MTSLAVFVLVAGLGLAASIHLYLRRESPVRGRSVLLALRAASILLVALILANPRLPGSAPGAPGAGQQWVLVDWGRALDVPAPEGGMLREQVLELATEEVRGGARLALAGPEPEGVDVRALMQAEPRSRLMELAAPLRRLVEAGADSVVVLSPFRLPPAAVRSAVEDSWGAVRLEQVGEPVRNAGVLSLELPASSPAGEALEGAVTLFGEGGDAADSVSLQVEADGELVESRTVALPPPGERRRLELSLPATADSGMVRYEARARLEGDVFPLDDGRVRWVRVGPPQEGVLVLSLRPDWEPRVLLPVLEGVTGLEGEGFLRLGGDDRWVPLGDGEDPAAPVESGAFRERLSRAALLVIHGANGQVPPWLASQMEAHPRTVHLPSGPEGARLAGLSPASPRTGEWTADPTIPPSPVAPYLSGIPLGGLPPLTDLRSPGEDGLVVFRVRARSEGEAVPAFILREDGGRRSAVALARGLWRWAHRGGDAREAYRGLWAGTAGWLLESDAASGPGVIRPREPVVPQDEGFEWVVDGGGPGELRLTFRPDAPREEVGGGDPRSSSGAETRTVQLDETGRGRSAPLPPGVWRWEGEAAVVETGGAGGTGAERTTVRGGGRVEVEAWDGSLSLPPLDSLPEGGAAEGGRAPERESGESGGQSLRTHPAPFLLLIGLLCAEWVVRRRRGLR